MWMDEVAFSSKQHKTSHRQVRCNFKICPDQIPTSDVYSARTARGIKGWR